MFEREAEEQGLPLKDWYVIGDRPADVEVGHRDGARTVLVNAAGYGGGAVGTDLVESELVEAAAFIAESCSPEHET